MNSKKARKTVKSDKPTSSVGQGNSFLFDLLEIVVQSLVIVFILFTFVFRLAGVDGQSMSPTLEHGDWLVVSELHSTYSAGDIVIISQPTSVNKPLVKRVIATEGQVVDIDFDTGEVSVDGVQLNEKYTLEKTFLSYDIQYPHTVAPGKVFVMGDNRNNSLDSRSSEVGDIDVDYIVGKAQYRVLPLNKFGGLYD